MSDWVVWGFKPSVVDGTPIKLDGGSLSQCRSASVWYSKHGWTCATYRRRTAPVGLRQQARAAQAEQA